MKSIIAILIALVAGVVAIAADRVTDPAARGLLVGKWTLSDGGASRIIEFKADGTGSQVSKDGKGNSIGFEFKWTVQDGVLAQTVTTSPNASQFPVGRIYTWNIVELTPTTFVHNTYPPVAGTRPVTTETRVKPEPPPKK